MSDDRRGSVRQPEVSPSSTETKEATSKASAKQELHKPPVFLFLLPLVIIIVIGYLTR